METEQAEVETISVIDSTDPELTDHIIANQKIVEAEKRRHIGVFSSTFIGVHWSFGQQAWRVKYTPKGSSKEETKLFLVDGYKTFEECQSAAEAFAKANRTDGDKQLTKVLNAPRGVLTFSIARPLLRLTGSTATTVSIGIRSKFQEVWQKCGGDPKDIGDCYIPVLRVPTKKMAEGIVEHYNELLKAGHDDAPFVKSYKLLVKHKSRMKWSISGKLTEDVVKFRNDFSGFKGLMDGSEHVEAILVPKECVVSTGAKGGSNSSNKGKGRGKGQKFGRGKKGGVPSGRVSPGLR